MAALVVVAVPVAAVLHPYFGGGGVTTSIPLDQLRDRYREATATTALEPSTRAPTSGPMATSPDDTTAPSAPSVPSIMPTPGVYLYATTGGDSIDALQGDHHDYPATTTITVIAEGCGVRQRWDVAEERWAQWRRCPTTGAVSQTGWTNYDMFFGRSQTDAYSCTGDPRPIDAPAGTTWSIVCTQGAEVDNIGGTVVGTEHRSVGGVDVVSLHVRQVVDPGTSSDSQVTDSWFLLGSDLLIARTATNATTEATLIGSVHYAEHYSLDLTSLEPLR
jgi:hypothetical protein